MKCFFGDLVELNEWECEKSDFINTSTKFSLFSLNFTYFLECFFIDLFWDKHEYWVEMGCIGICNHLFSCVEITIGNFG